MKTDIIHKEQFGDLVLIREKINGLLYEKQPSDIAIQFVYAESDVDPKEESIWIDPTSSEQVSVPISQAELNLAHAAVAEINSAITRTGNGEIVRHFMMPRQAQIDEKTMIIVSVE